MHWFHFYLETPFPRTSAMLNFPKFIHSYHIFPCKTFNLSAEAAVLPYRAFLFNCPVTEASSAPMYSSFSNFLDNYFQDSQLTSLFSPSKIKVILPFSLLFFTVCLSQPLSELLVNNTVTHKDRGELVWRELCHCNPAGCRNICFHLLWREVKPKLSPCVEKLGLTVEASKRECKTSD